MHLAGKKEGGGGRCGVLAILSHFYVPFCVILRMRMLNACDGLEKGLVMNDRIMRVEVRIISGAREAEDSGNIYQAGYTVEYYLYRI